MKKALNISLSAQSFVLEEDAHAKLVSYLEDIRGYLLADSSDEEAVKDIEAALAEKMKAKLHAGKETISAADIEEIMTVMGTREDFARDLGALDDGQVEKALPADGDKLKRRLYRDTDNGWLGGVASGLGNFFGISAGAFRIAFVLLAFYQGLGILIYVLAWIIIPRAKTYTEKLAMHGEAANLENIRLLSERMKEQSPAFLRTVVNNGTEMVSSLWPIVRRAAGVVMILGSLLLMSVTLFVAFTASLYRYSDILINYVPLKDLFALLPFYLFLTTGLALGLSLAAAGWQVGINWMRKLSTEFNFRLFAGLVIIALVAGSFFVALSLRYLPEVFQVVASAPGSQYQERDLDTDGIKVIQLDRGVAYVYAVTDRQTTVRLYGSERDLNNITVNKVDEGGYLYLSREKGIPESKCWGCYVGPVQIRIPADSNIVVLDADGEVIDYKETANESGNWWRNRLDADDYDESDYLLREW